MHIEPNNRRFGKCVTDFCSKNFCSGTWIDLWQTLVHLGMTLSTINVSKIQFSDCVCVYNFLKQVIRSYSYFSSILIFSQRVVVCIILFFIILYPDRAILFAWMVKEEAGEAHRTRGTTDRCSFRSDVLRKIRTGDMCRPTAADCCLERSYSFSFSFISLTIFFLSSWYCLVFFCSNERPMGNGQIDSIWCQSLIGKDLTFRSDTCYEQFHRPTFNC